MKYKQGDIVKHRASGFRGIILDGWEYGDSGWTYKVKFGVIQRDSSGGLITPIQTFVGHFVEECKDFELEKDGM